MIRNVSRDDYLMARGANPRTGIVTPGVQSSSSSFDENQELKARGIAPPPKWRQRGDQWISLEFGQPTPVPTPTSETGHRDPSLRTPPRLTHSKYNHGNKGPPLPPKSPRNRVFHAENEAITPSDLPGSFPKTPSASNSICIPNAIPDRGIKRKPVGSPSKDQLQETEEILDLYNDKPNQFSGFLREEGTRSSSAPARHKPDPFCPADIGADITPVYPEARRDMSNNTVIHIQPPQEPFLDPQPRRASAAVCQNQRTEKELPCLPTNNGQSQSPQLPKSLQIVRNRAPEDILTNLIIPQAPFAPSPRIVQGSNHPQGMSVRGPRDMVQAPPQMRINRSREPVVLEGPKTHAKGGRPIDVPFYDNPPPPSQEPPEIRHLKQSPQHGVMQRPQRPAPTSFDDILNMSTNTSMNTFTGTALPNQAVMRRTRQRNMDGAMPVPPQRRMDIPRPGRSRGPMPGLRGNMNMSMSMSSNDLIGVPMNMPRTRPREMQRPNMPDRTAAMRNVPTFNPGMHRFRRPMYDGTDMQPPYPWSTTGMPTTHSLPDIHLAGNSMQPLSHHDHIASGQPMRWPTQEVESTKATRASPAVIAPNESCLAPSRSLETGLYRKCSRCTGGRVQGQQDISTGTASIPLKAQKEQPHLDCVEEHQDEALLETRSVEVVKKEVVCQPPTPPARDTSEATLITDPRDPSTPLPQPVSLVSESATAIKVQTPSRPTIAPRRGSDDPLVLASSDDKDHSGCCPQCCKEQDCHDGCLGHPSPLPSPVKRVRSIDNSLHGRAGSITSLEGQPLTPLSERGKKLGLVRHAFKKSFQRTPSPNKTSRSPMMGARINNVDNIDGMFSELSSGPASPGTFWGGPSNRTSSTTAAQVGVNSLARSNSTGSDSPISTIAAVKAATASKTAPDGSSGAAAAAKAAIEKAEARKPAVLVKKQRANSKASKTTMGDVDKSDTARKVTPNEGRRVTSRPDQPEADNKDIPSPRTRRHSGASIATIELPTMPQITSLTTALSAVSEMALVPFEASKMWLRNHPTVGNGGWTIVNRAIEMLVVILGTVEACWRVVFVYSKTGRMRLPKIQKLSTDEDGKETTETEAMTPASFMWDCARSGVYVLIFLAVLVLLVRIVRWVLGVVRVVAMVLRGLAWVGRALLGRGILW